MNWTSLMSQILRYQFAICGLRGCTCDATARLFLSCDFQMIKMKNTTFVRLALCCSFIFAMIQAMGLLYGCFRIKFPLAKQCKPTLVTWALLVVLMHSLRLGPAVNSEAPMVFVYFFLINELCLNYHHLWHCAHIRFKWFELMIKESTG